MQTILEQRKRNVDREKLSRGGRKQILEKTRSEKKGKEKDKREQKGKGGMEKE